MGSDKALLPLLGRPLIQRVIERVAPLADELLVTTNHPETYRFLKVPLYPDIYPGIGALSGLCTALSVAHQSLVAAVACDMPFVNPAILSAARDVLLTTDMDVAIPRTQAGYEPFHAVYRRTTCLPAVKAAIEAGERRLISWFPAVQVAALSEEEILLYDPQQLAFWNLNTPEEFRQAEQLVQEFG